MFDIDEELVACDEGLANVLNVLDKLHNVDEQETALQYYEKFEGISRKSHQKVSEFVQEFEFLANNTKKSGNILSDELLAHKLLRALKLSDTDVNIIKAATPKFQFDELKRTVSRIYGENTYNTTEIKLEPVYHAQQTSCKCGVEDGGHQQEQKLQK